MRTCFVPAAARCSVVCYTADHGDMQWQFQRFGKGVERGKGRGLGEKARRGTFRRADKQRFLFVLLSHDVVFCHAATVQTDDAPENFKTASTFFLSLQVVCLQRIIIY